MLVVVNIAYIRIFIDYVPRYHFLKAYLNCNVHEILSPHVIEAVFYILVARGQYGLVSQ